MQPGSPLHRSPCWRCWEILSTITGRTAIMRRGCARPLKPQDMPRLLFWPAEPEDPLVYQAGRDFAHRMQAEGAPMTYYEAQGGYDHVFWKHAMTPLCEFLTAKGGK